MPDCDTAAPSCNAATAKISPANTGNAVNTVNTGKVENTVNTVNTAYAGNAVNNAERTV